MIDVIIPSYNRADSLRKVVDSYLSQPELARIIFVDDCSTDDTEAFVSALKQQYPEKIIYYKMQEKSTLPAVRNAGISLTQAKYIFMGEDDVILPERHFKILLQKMDELGADIISGRRIYLFEGQTREEAEDFANKDTGPVFMRIPFEGYFERVVRHSQRVPYVHSNSLIKKHVFEKVLYDPWYGGNAFREELDFYLRAYKAGFALWLIPDTLSYHFKNFSVNKKGGARKKRLIYEWQVWKNTIRCFWKNREIMKKEFNIINMPFFILICLLARYTNAFRRRIKWNR